MGCPASRHWGLARVRPSQERHHARETQKKKSTVDIADRQWPCTNRHHLIHLIRAHVFEGQIRRALNLAKQLNKSFGIGIPGEDSIDPKDIVHEPDENEAEHFILDRRASVLMYNMIGFIKNQPPEWKDQVCMICTELSGHVAPPRLRGSFPLDDIPIRELVLTCLDLYKTITKIGTVRSIIDRNPSITKIEMSYTGITTDSFKMLLPSMSNLDYLVFLGLRGNRLEKSIVTEMTLIMENRRKFKSLKWVDFRNNVDIFTAPKKFLQLLKVRWNPNKMHLEFRTVAEEISQLGLFEYSARKHEQKEVTQDEDDGHDDELFQLMEV